MKNRVLCLITLLSTVLMVAKATPSFDLSDGFLAFGEVEVGSEPVTKTFTIINLSADALDEGTTWTLLLETPSLDEHYSYSKSGNTVTVTFDPQSEVWESTNLVVRATAASGDFYQQTIYLEGTGIEYDNTFDVSLVVPEDMLGLSAGEYSIDDITAAMGGTLQLPWYDSPSKLVGQFHVIKGSNVGTIPTVKNTGDAGFFTRLNLSDVNYFYLSVAMDAVGTYSTTVTASGTLQNGMRAGSKVYKSFDLTLYLFYVGLDLQCVDKTSSSLTAEWKINPFATEYNVYINDVLDGTYTNTDAVDGAISHTFSGLSDNADYEIKVVTTIPDQTGGSDLYYPEESIQARTIDAQFDVFNAVPYNFPWNAIPVPGMGEVTFPLSDIDLTNAFDDNHKALMDSLYVITNYFPAQIIKSELSGYASVMLIFGKRTEYTYSLIDARLLPEYGYRTLSDIDGKKLYFSGQCDSLGTGGIETHGFITLVGKGTNISGQKGDNVDIYLDNFRVSTKNKLIDFDPTNINQAFSLLMSSQSEFGTAAPFAISSRGEYGGGQEFTVNFHTVGENKLQVGSKTSTGIDPKSGSGLMGAIMSVLVVITEPTASAVLVRPDATTASGVQNIATAMNFDDKWPTNADDFTQKKSTNGHLDMSPKVGGDRSAPSVDLGSKYGTATFDGGRYTFTCAASNSMFYVSSMAICYRHFIMSFSGLDINMMGISTSMGSESLDESVVFKDGSFYTKSAEDYTDVMDVVAQGWYNNYTDLRVPISTTIKGGTFNGCDVYLVDASAEMGTEPRQWDADANDGNGEYIRLCKQTIPAETTNSDGTAVLSSADYAWVSTYGSSSLTPLEGYVYPYLNDGCSDEDVNYSTRNWVTLIPVMGANFANMIKMTMGGDTKVYTEDYKGNPLKNSFLFYAQLNKYTIKNAHVYLGSYPVTVGQAMSGGLGEGVSHPSDATIERFENCNANAYRYDKNDNKLGSDFQIEHGLYTMLSYHPNRSYMICPPYDVHNVYVLETYPDEQAIADGVEIGSDEYLKNQGVADGRLAQGIVTSLLPDILSGKGTGVNLSLPEIATQTLKMQPYILEHYDGTNDETANYFLYEYKDMANDEIFSQEERGVFSDDSYFPGYPGLMPLSPNTYGTDSLTKTYYQTHFDYVNRESNELGTYVDREGNVTQARPIMKKGHIYSIFLPSDGGFYWEGKYLAFEGLGPQTISGYGKHADFMQESSDLEEKMEWVVDDYPEMNFNFDGLAKIQGNPTMVNYTTKEPSFKYEAMTSHAYDDGTDFSETADAASGYYYHDWVKQEAGTIIRPWEVFMVMNKTNSDRYDSFSELYYEEMLKVLRHHNQTTDNNLPQLSDFAMSVLSQNSKLMMHAFVNQKVSVYTTTGVLVWTGSLNANDTKTITVPQGVYIVQGENDRTKIMVR